jgi:hypothetical protein
MMYFYMILQCYDGICFLSKGEVEVSGKIWCLSFNLSVPSV